MKCPTSSKYNFFDSSPSDFKVCLKSSCYESRSTKNFVQGPFCFPDIWVLDYSLNDGSMNKVANDSYKSSGWETRPVRCAHLYPPGCSYWDKPPQGTTIHKDAYITFSGGEMLGLDKYVKNSKGFCCFYDKLGVIGDLLIESASMLAPLGSDGFFIGQSYLFKIIDALQHFESKKNDWERHYPAVREDGSGGNITFVGAVRQHLQDNFTKPLNLDDIAQTLNVSKSTLSHKFKVLSGESPFQALISIRINAVKALLLKRERLKSIAEQTGFYDEYHLSKMFKRFTGMSPKDFINRNYEKK